MLVPMLSIREPWTELASHLATQTLYAFEFILEGLGVKYYVLVAHAGLLYGRIRRCLEAREIVSVMI
jgi:hypothetical protein